MGRIVNAFLAAARLHLKIQSVTPLAMAMTVMSPVVWGLIVASAVGDAGLAVIVGTGLAAMASAIPAESVITILQERHWLTLEQIAMSPVHTGVVLVGRVAAMMLHALAALPIAGALLIAIYGRPTVRDPVQLAAALVIAIAGLMAVSLFIIGLVARRRYHSGAPNAVFPIVILLAGVFVPVQSLPSWLEPVARLLAVSWAMEAVRLMEAGFSGWSSIGIGALVAGSTVSAGAIYVGRVEEVMRRSAEAYLR